MTENVLIVGATSGIARAVARGLAEQGHRLILAGRQRDALEAMARDLTVRYEAEAAVEVFDASDTTTHAELVARAFEHFGGDLTGAFLCYGTLPDQKQCEQDFAAAQQAIAVNFVSYVSLLHELATRFEQRRQGWLCAVSSVAGDRGRQSNYVYGSAKAGLSTFLEGLRNRLHPHGVQVITIKPGQVLTPMTEGIVNPKSPLVAKPERVGRDIVRAIQARRNCIYTPWIYRIVMSVIWAIPEMLFKRLKL